MCGNGVRTCGTITTTAHQQMARLGLRAEIHRAVCCAVARGTATPATAGRLIGTATPPVTGASTAASALPYSLAACCFPVTSFELRKKRFGAKNS